VWATFKHLIAGNPGHVPARTTCRGGGRIRDASGSRVRSRRSADQSRERAATHPADVLHRASARSRRPVEHDNERIDNVEKAPSSAHRSTRTTSKSRCWRSRSAR
jgi:hypothetical protein